MQRQYYWLLAIVIVIVDSTQHLSAGFAISLSVDAGGRVIVRPDGGAPMLPDPSIPSDIYFTKDNLPAGPLSINGDSVQLVAVSTSFSITRPTDPVALAYGSDLLRAGK